MQSLEGVYKEALCNTHFITLSPFKKISSKTIVNYSTARGCGQSSWWQMISSPKQRLLLVLIYGCDTKQNDQTISSLFTSNSFIMIQFTYHTIYLLKVYKWFQGSSQLCNHYQNQIYNHHHDYLISSLDNGDIIIIPHLPKYLTHQQLLPSTLSHLLLFPKQGKKSVDLFFCLHNFASPGHLT